MEDNAPEHILVGEMTKLARKTGELGAILAARAAEAGGARFRPASEVLDIGTRAVERASTLTRLVADLSGDVTLRRGGFIITHTGRRFWPLDPKAEDCDAEDMALSLCQKGRWNCLMVGAYTVGEHSIRVGRVARVLAVAAGLSEELCELAATCGYLHDAHEAYLTDMPKPLKPFFPEWASLEEGVQEVIHEYLGLGPIPAELEPIVKKADYILLVMEADAGFTKFDPHTVPGWSLPRMEEMGLPSNVLSAVLKAAAIAETWPRSFVSQQLHMCMTKLLVARRKRDEQAVIQEAADKLVPHSGLREQDPHENDAKWQKVAEHLGADVGPVDLEAQLRAAEQASARRGGSKS